MNSYVILKILYINILWLSDILYGCNNIISEIPSLMVFFISCLVLRTKNLSNLFSSSGSISYFCLSKLTFDKVRIKQSFNYLC
jgi:hypothetical protein